jgi:ArsR family transcriptional regulator, lead/cadmium/zinc/bismuth-responsive transcriptional repressor
LRDSAGFSPDFAPLHGPGHDRGTLTVRGGLFVVKPERMSSYQPVYERIEDVHLVPVERRTRRILEEERVCKAIDAVGEPANVALWANRFAQLGDPSRLALLLAIAQAGPISVTDLAVATDMNDTTVSQALRLLRASGTVVARRDGRINRYELADDQIGQLLKQVSRAQLRRRQAIT